MMPIGAIGPSEWEDSAVRMSEERVVHELRTQAAEPLGANRAVGLAGGLCACAFVLALASGSVSSRVGAPAGFRLSSIAGDAASVVAGLVFVVGAGLFLWARHAARMSAGSRAKGSMWERLLALVVLVVVIALAGRVVHTLEHIFRPPGERASAGLPRGVTRQKPVPVAHGHVTWVEVVAVGVGVALGFLVLYALLRSPRRHGDESGVGGLDSAISAGIDDLESERDTRRAVIKAYARMERALAAEGLPRRPSETPLEFLRRVLAGLHVGGHPVSRLTSLFERARFSQHEVDEPMRREAIDALSELRAELGG
jgi:Domain of unknown function (DUF4129)